MSPTPEDPLRTLAALVVKDRVGLGGLPQGPQAQALAWVWAGLPEGLALSEREVNEALKAQLDAAAVWLDTDHVELRRWLVDAGWLQRDGWGREYRRVPAARIAPEWQALAAACAAVDTAAWTAQRRAAQAVARAERRRLWQGGSVGRDAPGEAA